MNDFYKFPTTPHLIKLGPYDIRTDKIMSEFEQLDFLKNKLIVEEKADGANLGISFNTEGDLLLQNRSSFVNTPYHGQWSALGEWLNYREETIFDTLGDRYVLYGEWCYAQHSISYSKLPDYFLGFDVLDKKYGKFLNYENRNNIFSKCNLSIVPFISMGFYSTNELLELIRTPSQLGTASLEGIYLRFDKDGWLGGRAKIVQSSFMQTISEHWSKQKIRPNRIGYEEN